MTEGQPQEYTAENVNELVGGIKNAIDRGEELNKAKQSFVNAGYTSQEIDEAIAKLGIIEQPLQERLTKPTPEKILPQQNPSNIPVVNSPLSNKIQIPSIKSLPPQKPSRPTIILPPKKSIQRLPVEPIKETPPMNKALVVILIILGILFVVIAGFLGVFWDQLFGPF